MLTYVFEVATDGPYYYATLHRLLGGISHVLIAILVFKVSQMAKPSGSSRLLVNITVVVSLVGAVLLILGTSGLLGFSESSLVAVVVLVVQALWMLRANTWLYHQGIFPPILARFGQVIGAGLLIGIALVAASVFLPRLTLPHLIILVAGVFIGGGQWLAWPIWFVMLGWHLRKAPDAVAKFASDVAVDADARGPQDAEPRAWADAAPPTVPDDDPSRRSTWQPPSAAEPELLAPPMWRHRSAAVSRPPDAAPTKFLEGQRLEPSPEPEPESDFDRVINPRPATEKKREPGIVPKPKSNAAVAPRPVDMDQPQPDAEDVLMSRPSRVKQPEPPEPQIASQREPQPAKLPEPQPAKLPEPQIAKLPESTPSARPASKPKSEARAVTRASKPRSVQPPPAKVAKAQPRSTQQPDPDRLTTSRPPRATKTEPKAVSQDRKPQSAPPAQPPSAPQSDPQNPSE